MQGWLKIYRELIDKPIWLNSTPEQKTILITLLCIVNHYPNSWEWQGEKFALQPGQVITSLESIAKRAGKGISIQNVRTAIDRFQKLNFITNKSTKTGRLITIVNWELYQSDEENQQSSWQSTNKDLTTKKECKNVKNNKYSSSFEEFWTLYPRNVGKGEAFSQWIARLKEGVLDSELIKAAKNYADDCRRKGTELEYIKHPRTFLSSKRPYEDYINCQLEQKTIEASGYRDLSNYKPGGETDEL